MAIGSVAANFASLRVFTGSNLALLKLFTINQRWSFWLYTKYLMNMFLRFWIIFVHLTFGRYLAFHPNGHFPPITWFLGMIHCLFLEGLKDYRFFKMCANFLFRGCLQNLLLKFKIGLSLGISCLMPSIFKIIFNYINYFHNYNSVLW